MSASFPRTHRIRLRKPWNRLYLAADQAIRPDALTQLTDAVVVDMPDLDPTKPDASKSADRRFYYLRSFNTPAGLDVAQRVYLEVQPVHPPIQAIAENGLEIFLNHHQPVPSGLYPAWWDLTGMLLPQSMNQLAVVTARGSADQLNAQISLQIVEAD